MLQSACAIARDSYARRAELHSYPTVVGLLNAILRRINCR